MSKITTPQMFKFIGAGMIGMTVFLAVVWLFVTVATKFGMLASAIYLIVVIPVCVAVLFKLVWR
jgi:hypothetical protein